MALAGWLGLAVLIGQMAGITEGMRTLTGREIFKASSAHAQEAGKGPDYAQVDAIFGKYHCTVCHGGAEPRGGLGLDSHASLLKGGKSGPVVIPGDSGKSELSRRLKGVSEPRMPYTGPPWLADEEVAVIQAWIAAGAKEGK
jgi:uncharacterized membrane protein